MPAQHHELIRALKAALRSRGMTYSALAQALQISEASVKRCFSQNQFTLDRFSKILDVLEMDFAELVEFNEKQKPSLDALSFDAERALVETPALLLVAIAAIGRWSFEEIHRFYDLDEPALIRHLARLDRLGLIALQPGNRIKLQISPRFRWRPEGPVMQYFKKRVLPEFMQSDFERSDERLHVANFMLSAQSNAVIQDQLDRLMRQVELLQLQDSKLPIDQRLGNTLVMAIRRWNFSEFSNLRRR
ncbi:MAG: helix-turn-helix transcriptional regulator [Gammaproteobacteria bacterium]|nr:helix-turn-helix transcriptional regulator [Gammaproteobacteria bacterium]